MTGVNGGNKSINDYASICNFVQWVLLIIGSDEVGLSNRKVSDPF